jgi:hypothetical protein
MALEKSAPSYLAKTYLSLRRDNEFFLRTWKDKNCKKPLNISKSDFYKCHSTFKIQYHTSKL